MGNPAPTMIVVVAEIDGRRAKVTACVRDSADGAQPAGALPLGDLARACLDALAPRAARRPFPPIPEDSMTTATDIAQVYPQFVDAWAPPEERPPVLPEVVAENPWGFFDRRLFDIWETALRLHAARRPDDPDDLASYFERAEEAMRQFRQRFGRGPWPS